MKTFCDDPAAESTNQSFLHSITRYHGMHVGMSKVFSITLFRVWRTFDYILARESIIMRIIGFTFPPPFQLKWNLHRSSETRLNFGHNVATKSKLPLHVSSLFKLPFVLLLLCESKYASPSRYVGAIGFQL